MGTKQKVLFIFLLLITCILVIYILFNSFSFFTQTKNYVDDNSQKNVDCVGPIYSISNPEYDGNTLTVTVMNEKYSSQQLNQLTIESDQEYIKDVTIPIGVERKITIETNNPPNQIKIYLTGCETNAKTCDLQTKTCQ